MPGQDKTGPKGKGERTGRGLGPCAPGSSNNEPVQNTPPRDGQGRGPGRGRGREKK